MAEHRVISLWFRVVITRRLGQITKKIREEAKLAVSVSHNPIALVDLSHTKENFSRGIERVRYQADSGSIS